MAKLRELGRRLLAWCTQHKAISAVMIAAIVLIIPVHQVFAVDLWTEFTQNPLDATALILAGLIQNITALLGKVMLLLIEMIVIPILGYNGFYNSNITNLGWSLVRDVVNMFVVVVLLVIAVMTIVGYSAANWTQQLPRLFIAIVLVNFSKLICGVFIDMSQVIMFTFVNAIVSIAAGNFASMFAMDTFGQFNADFLDEVSAEGSGIEAYMYLGAAYLNFVIYLAILSVLFLLAVAFTWRIIVLWLLIIMSPLAFFMIGIKDIFHTAAGMFDTWKKKFISALTFGPALAFFLWLALAASSGSTLAQTEDFPMPDEPTDLGLPLEMFSLDNFLGMFLALAILIAGMQQASSMAKGMEGFASAVISDKMGMGLVKGLARPFKSTKRLGKAALTGGKVGNTQVPGLANIAPGYTQKFGKMAAGLGQKVGGAAGAGIISRTVGGALAGAGAFAVGAGKDERKKRNKAGAESAEHMTEEQKKAYNLARADVARGRAVIQEGQKAYDIADAANDEEGKKAAKAMMKRGRAIAAPGEGVLAQYGENELHGARMKELLTKEKAQKDFKKDLEEKYKAEFKQQGLAGAALDNAVNSAVKTDFDNVMRQHIKMSKTDEGKAFMQLTSEEKDSIEDTMTANPHLIEPTKEQIGAGMSMEEAKENAIKAHFQAMEDKKRLNVGAISAGSFTDKTTRKALEGFMREGRDGKKISLWSEMESGKGTIAQRKAIVGLITAENLNDATDGKKNFKTLVSAGAVADDNALDPAGSGARRKAVISQIQDTDARTVDPTTHGAAAAALLSYNEGKSGAIVAKDVFGTDFDSLGSDGEDIREGLAAQTDAMLRSDISSARHFENIVTEDTGHTHATAMIADRASRSAVQRLESVRNSGGPGSEESMRALDVISRSVDAELVREQKRPEGRRDKNRIRKLQDVKKEITVGGRYQPGRLKNEKQGDADAIAAAKAEEAAREAAEIAAAIAKAKAAEAAKGTRPDDDDTLPPPRRGGGGSGGSGGSAPPPQTPPTSAGSNRAGRTRTKLGGADSGDDTSQPSADSDQDLKGMYGSGDGSSGGGA